MATSSSVCEQWPTNTAAEFESGPPELDKVKVIQFLRQSINTPLPKDATRAQQIALVIQCLEAGYHEHPQNISNTQSLLIVGPRGSGKSFFLEIQCLSQFLTSTPYEHAYLTGEINILKFSGLIHSGFSPKDFNCQLHSAGPNCKLQIVIIDEADMFLDASESAGRSALFQSLFFPGWTVPAAVVPRRVVIAVTCITDLFSQLQRADCQIYSRFAPAQVIELNQPLASFVDYFQYYLTVQAEISTEATAAFTQLWNEAVSQVCSDKSVTQILEGLHALDHNNVQAVRQLILCSLAQCALTSTAETITVKNVVDAFEQNFSLEWRLKVLSSSLLSAASAGSRGYATEYNWKFGRSIPPEVKLLATLYMLTASGSDSETVHDKHGATANFTMIYARLVKACDYRLHHDAREIDPSDRYFAAFQHLADLGLILPEKRHMPGYCPEWPKACGGAPDRLTPVRLMPALVLEPSLITIILGHAGGSKHSELPWEWRQIIIAGKQT